MLILGNIQNNLQVQLFGYDFSLCQWVSTVILKGSIIFKNNKGLEISNY